MLYILLAFFILFVTWNGTGSTWYAGQYCTSLGWWYKWVWTSSRNQKLQKYPRYRHKTCPGAAVSTTNLIRPDLDSKPGCSNVNPVTNRLSGRSYGMTFTTCLSLRIKLRCRHLESLRKNENCFRITGLGGTVCFVSTSQLRLEVVRYFLKAGVRFPPFGIVSGNVRK
jgi:hypothetical protein